MKSLIVIPTYWGRSAGEPFNPVDTVYDHPTPLDEPGTLARTLDSLASLNIQDTEIVVIAVATNPALEQAVEDKVTTIVKQYDRRLPVCVLSYTFAAAAKNALTTAGYPESADLVNLYGYSNVRNFCLVAGCVRQAEAVVLVDDDEVVEDPDYLAKAVEFIGTEQSGGKVTGVAGWYMRPDGGYLGPATRDWWWREWLGAEAMNDAFKLVIGNTPRLKVTPFAFGGNMVIHRDLFEKVVFDPNVPRGEDIDYVFNAKMFGHDFLLDRELWIRHLPPVSHVPDWLGFRKNAMRFAYMKKKFDRQDPGRGLRTVTLDELRPYPGRFLDANLNELIEKTSRLLASRYESEQDDLGRDEALRTIDMVNKLTRDSRDPLAGYLKLAEAWSRLAEELAADARLRADMELAFTCM
ncbi:MAG: glycosyltransferase [Actinomycetota bacterium]